MTTNEEVLVYRGLPDAMRLFTCSDCDPTNHDPDEDEIKYDRPYQLLLPVDPDSSPDASCEIENCPRCGSYLSLLGDYDVVTVKLYRHPTVVARRLAAKAAKEAPDAPAV